jgi:integrase
VEQWDADFMRRLKTQFGDFLRLDLATSTQQTYASQQQQHKAFCSHMGVAQQPAADVLAKFIVGRAMHGYRLSTIECGVSAVARWGSEQGGGDLTSSPIVQQSLRVAAKYAVPSNQQKLPLDRADLRKVVVGLRERKDFIGRRDAALFLVGWAVMCRVSELVAINWRDVHFQDSRGVMIYVPSSKTDQAGEGAWVFVAEARDDPVMCPVRALKELQSRYGGTGPVFTSTVRGQRLSKNTVGARLKKALRAVDVENLDLYSAHSLRRGGGTYALKSGVPLRQV